MLPELASVVLLSDLPQYGLAQGDVGTIVLVHGDQGYEVEFTTLDGRTVAVVSVAADQVRRVGPHDITHARTLVGS